MEERQILYGAWYGAAALHLLMEQEIAVLTGRNCRIGLIRWSSKVAPARGGSNPPISITEVSQMADERSPKPFIQVQVLASV